MELKDLTLFYRPTCPFCKKVLKSLNDAGIEVAKRDIDSDPEAKVFLEKEGGKAVVPCVRIEENGGVRWQYESNDIIAFFNLNFSLKGNPLLFDEAKCEVYETELSTIADKYNLENVIISAVLEEKFVVTATSKDGKFMRGSQTYKASHSRAGEKAYGEKVIATKEAFIVEDAAIDEEWRVSEQFVKLGFGGYAGVPLIKDGTVIGIVEVFQHNVCRVTNGSEAFKAISELAAKVQETL